MFTQDTSSIDLILGYLIIISIGPEALFLRRMLIIALGALDKEIKIEI
jgi:hypothetical protein